MIKPRFTQADIHKHIANRLAVIEREIIGRLHVLGIRCVQISRGEGNNDPSGFPIKYGDSKNAQPLKQRLINARDKDRNPSVTAPAFGDFLEHTGNLKASISYFIIKDGKVIDGDLGAKGATEAHKIAKLRARNIRKGYGLVVVAGQKYAQYVEARGYDVITSAEVFAKKEIPAISKEIMRKLKQ